MQMPLLCPMLHASLLHSLPLFQQRLLPSLPWSQPCRALCFFFRIQTGVTQYSTVRGGWTDIRRARAPRQWRAAIRGKHGGQLPSTAPLPLRGQQGGQRQRRVSGPLERAAAAAGLLLPLRLLLQRRQLEKELCHNRIVPSVHVTPPVRSMLAGGNTLSWRVVLSRQRRSTRRVPRWWREACCLPLVVQAQRYSRCQQLQRGRSPHLEQRWQLRLGRRGARRLALHA